MCAALFSCRNALQALLSAQNRMITCALSYAGPAEVRRGRKPWCIRNSSRIAAVCSVQVSEFDGLRTRRGAESEMTRNRHCSDAGLRRRARVSFVLHHGRGRQP
jgi:hypothetical protein